MFTLESFYSLKRRGILTLVNNGFLYNLYLPLIGYKALFIYAFLVNEYLSNQIENKVSYLLKKCQMSTSDFLLNKKSLESIGLIQTLEKDDSYVFVLKSVLSPNDFFNNVVLKGLYVSKVGKDEALKMMKFYEIDDVNFNEYVDISAGVNETFKIDFAPEDCNLNKDAKLVTINKNVIKDSFDDTKLIECIAKTTNIEIKELTEDDIHEMHRLGTLYGLSESIMSFILSEGYDFSLPENHKIDYKYCNNRCKLEVGKYKIYNQKKEKIKINSGSKIANLINDYENTSPRLFLKNKQNGVNPVRADLDIIDYLSNNMGLSSGVINCILDYTLTQLQNKLNKKYCEKVAASIIREGIKNSLDAYSYLHPIKKVNKTEQIKKAPHYKKDECGEEKNVVVSDEEIGDLL